MNKIPKPLHQNKTGTQKRQIVFIFRTMLIKLSFYLEFKIKFILQLLKVAIEATFVTILYTLDAKLNLLEFHQTYPREEKLESGN